MLTNEEIADCMLSDIQAYKENIREIIIGRLMDSTAQRVYWDAWFRGADGKDLEDADRGVVYPNRRFIYLAKLGIIESTNENGEYAVQRIDCPEEIKEEFGLSFLPPLLDSDEEAVSIFKSLTHDQLDRL